MAARIFLFLAAALFLTVPAGFLHAEPGPSPSASEAPIGEAEFLGLPAHDVEIFKGTEPVRVGDTLVLKVPGVPADSKLVPNDTLEEQGWLLQPVPEGEANPGELRFRASPLKPGDLTLPSLAIRDSTEKPRARTHPFRQKVTSAIKPEDEKPQEPAPLRPPLKLGFPWWITVVGALLFAALLGAAIYAWKKLRKSAPPVLPQKPAEPPLSEDEEAFVALSHLENQSPLKQGDFKPHYFRLSEIMKTYLGRRYRFDALESTTREIIAALDERKNVPEGTTDRIEHLFETLDRVKFTDHIPLPSEGWDLLKEARELVSATRRLPQFAPLLPSEKGGPS